MVEANNRFRQKKGAYPDRSTTPIAEGGQAPFSLVPSADRQLMTVMPTRFCAQAASFEPTTIGRSLP